MYIERGKKNITEEGLERSSAVLMPAGSILYSSRAPIGYVVISKNPISTNQGFKSLVPAVSGMSEFYYFVLKARTADIKQRATGTTFKEISGYDFGDTFVPLPPLAEQQRIVAQIETLLGYVDIIDTDAETLEKSINLAKQKILDLAIRGKLVPQDPADEPASELLKKIKGEKDALVKAGKLKKDKHESYIFKSDDNCYHENIDGKITNITDEIPFDLPDGWEWCKIKVIAKEIFAGGDKPEIFSKKKTEECQIPIYSNGIEKNGLYGFTNLPRVTESAVTISARGTIGFSCIRRTPFLPIIRLITIIPSTQLDITFVQYAVRKFMISSEGSSIPQLTVPTISEFLFPLPPLAEQKRIVSQVEKLFSVLETMRG